MLSWVLIFFIAAMLAAIMGFGGIATSMAAVAKILFFVFLVMSVISFILGRRMSS